MQKKAFPIIVKKAAAHTYRANAVAPYAISNKLFGLPGCKKISQRQHSPRFQVNGYAHALYLQCAAHYLKDHKKYKRNSNEKIK